VTKDCQCITHDGPHWLHMDSYTRASNRELLDYAKKLAEEAKTAMDAHFVHVLLNRFVELEIVRLQAKERELQRLGITQHD
jgi:hypothetical protein